MASVTVSCEGDQDFKDALTILARERKTTVAKVVRAALERDCGQLLERKQKQLARERRKVDKESNHAD